MGEDINELKRLFYSDRLTQYGKRKFIDYYEQRIKELEEEITMYKDMKEIMNSKVSGMKIVTSDEYIPASLVEEKIEELNKQLEEDLQDERKVNSNRFIIIYQCKNCLQKLLERRK